MSRRFILPGFLIGAVALLPAVARGAGASQEVTTQRLSLPSGPGSLEGLGESFEPQLNTGTFVFRIPFKFTKLRGAAAPEASLTYNSGSGNGPVGIGWSLQIPFLQRQTDKGLPSYTAADTIVESSGEELVKLTDGTFRAENEAAFTRWENPGARGWKATLRDGTVLRFGESAQARLDRSAALGGGTFKWMLERVEDTNGNRVDYTWIADAGQLYISEIVYGAHASETSATLRVSFGYAEGRPDAFADYRSRFLIQTRKRLESVTLWQGARRLRHWKLDYWSGYHLSLLKSVTMFGDQRSNTGAGAVLNTDYLPPVSMDYARQEIGQGWQMHTVGPWPMTVTLADRAADLVDVNRDGLPDIVYSEADTPQSPATYYTMLNRGMGQDFAPAGLFVNQGSLPDLRLSGVRIGDWRGDGRVKLMNPGDQQTPDANYREFTSATTLGPEVNYPLRGFTLTDPQVQSVDVNNDRAVDLIAPDGNRFEMLLSSPAGGTQQYLTSPVTEAGSVNFTAGWQFADMNGDRIADLVAVGTANEGGTVYYPHRGLGEFDPPVTMTGGPSNADLGNRENGRDGHPSLSLVDIDLDGLADLVMVDAGIVRIWPNRSGAGWGGLVEFSGNQIPGWNEPDAQHPGTAVRFADMNGNGSVDIVWNDPGAGYFLKYLELHPHTKPNQLISMSSGTGKTLAIEYKSSVDLMLADSVAGRPWTAVPPFPVPVVCAFTERDGMGSTYRTQISYRNGYYDAVEREFRGFETAVRTDVGNAAQGAPSLVTEYLFHTGSDIEALKGRPRQVERREAGGAIFDRVSSAWGTRQLPVGIAPGESRKVTFCFQQNETMDVLEKGSGPAVQLFKEMEWDDYGNQTRLADYGRVEGANRSAWDDERVITRTFTSAFPSGLQQWILGLTVDETIADENGAVKSKTENYYDDPSFAGNNRGVVTKGNLTLRRKAVDPAANQWISAARNRYDAFGNVTGSWDPLGDPANAAAGHFRIFSYDAEFHTYAETEQIELGSTGAVPRLAAKAEYDRGLGLMTVSTDFNDNQSAYQYDTFGRIAAIVKPGDSTAAPTETYDYKLGMPVGGGRVINWITASKRETTNGGTVDSRMFFDGLGRKVMIRSEGETAAETVVTGTVVFNDRRTEWKKYLPYFDSGGLDWKDPSFQAGFVENEYDAAGRMVRAWQPLVDGYRAFSRVTYSPLSRLVEDEEQTRAGSVHSGCGMRYTDDGLKNDKGEGRLRKVEEIVKLSDTGQSIASPVAWPTAYSYDILDNLTEIRDSQNNVKPMQYDGLSRLTFMDDPDRGVMRYTYDAASNLTESLDAKGQRIVMTYDGANRIAAEDYLDAAGKSPDVAYHYDSAAPVDAGDGGMAGPANLKGNLAFVADLSGAEHSSYDARGRLMWRIKRVTDPRNGVLSSYKSQFAYDAMDRLVRFHCPDGDFCGYGYNSRGLTESISGGPGGIITGIDYEASGQMKAVRYGNSVDTGYSYDPRLRLSSLITRQSLSGTQLINFAYTFDAASNITGIADNRPQIPDTDPRENTQQFTYDSLYRITSAKYPAFVNGLPGTVGSSRVDLQACKLEYSIVSPK